MHAVGVPLVPECAPKTRHGQCRDGSSATRAHQTLDETPRSSDAGTAHGGDEQGATMKARLIEFGPFADRDRRGRGQGKPETFNFLGFTHICGKKRSGMFTVLRQTVRQRLQAKLQAVKAELRRRMHVPIPEQGAYLRSVVGGHVRYYGVPMNGPAIGLFRRAVGRLWRRAGGASG